jgi:HSP20 family protein
MEQMRDFSSRPGGCRQAKFTPWAPATEVFSERGDLVIRVEVPGLEPDEVDLTLEDGLLTISGERKVASETAEARHYYLREPLYGPFRRTVNLPAVSEESGETHTEFGNGVLEVIVEGAASRAGKTTLDPSTSTC